MRNKASFLVVGLSLISGMLLSAPGFADSRYHWRDVSKPGFFNNPKLYQDMNNPAFWNGALPPLPPKEQSRCVYLTGRFMACGDGVKAKIYTVEGRSVSVRENKFIVNPPSANDVPGILETKASAAGAAK